MTALTLPPELVVTPDVVVTPDAVAANGLPAEPKSFYRRPLPGEHIPFSAAEGRQLFREALANGDMECWFALSEQFHTQAEPAFCGLGSLVVVLNALEIDPGRVWKGPWRWFSESLLDCCMPLHVVQEKGVTLDELACLARCNGARASAFRPDEHDLDALRRAVVEASRATRGPFVVASYSRSLLGQTGSGHFSPVAGYHRDRDLVLILDVARFKYPPHWVPLAQLWQAMQGVDPATGRPRGWLLLERGRSRPTPMYLRLLASHGIGDLARVLLEQTPALLAEVPAPDAETWLAGWVAALSQGGAGQIHDRLQAMPDVQSLSAEHRIAVARLLSELHEARAFKCIAAALGGSSSPVSAELLTVLLLALPSSALAALSEAQRGVLAELHDDLAEGSLLDQELAALRDQLVMLSQAYAEVRCVGTERCNLGIG